MYNDFLSDTRIPLSQRYQCQTCEQWIANGVHTCHCAAEERGEDVSKCECAIHRNSEMLKEVLSKGDDLHIIPTKKGKRIGVLEFYDEWDLKMALNGSKWGFAMLDLDNDLRGIIKHDEAKSDDYINALEYVRDALRNYLADRDISLGDLY